MSANSNVGYATLSIIPSAKGFGAALDKGVLPVVTSAGKEHGKKYGEVYTKEAMGPLRGLGEAAAAIFAVDKAKEFLSSIIEGAREAQKATALTTQVIKSTGGAAHVSAKEVEELSSALSRKTGIERVTIQTGENLLLTFTNIKNEVGRGNDVYNRATLAALNMSAAMKTDLHSSIVQVGKALNDPIRGLTSLQRVGVTFTAQQREQIKKLTESGHALTAQKLILDQLTKKFGGAAASQATAGDKMRASWVNLKEEMGAHLLPVIDKFETFISDKVIPAVFAVGGALSDLWSGFTVGTDALGSAQSRWAVFGAVLYEYVAPVVATVRDYLQQLQTVIATQVVPALETLWAYFSAKILPVFEQAVSLYVTKVLPVLAEVASFILGKVVPAVLSIYESVAAKLAPILDALVQSIETNILPALAGVYTKFQTWLPTIEAVVMVVLKVTGFLLKLAATILGDVLPPLVKLTGFLLGTVIDVLGTLIGWIVKVVAGILDIPSAMKTAYHAVADKFGDIVSFVAGMPGKIGHAASGMWDGIKDAFRDAIDWIIRGWNGLQFHMPSIDTHIPGVGKIGGFDIGMPDIPLLANGGIATRATLAMIGEGSQPEAVIPLDKLSAIMRGRYGDSPPAAGAPSGSARTSGAREYVAPILLDGRQIAEAVFAVGGSDLYYGRKVDG